MKYALFADIHSNLEALEVVLEYFKQRGADAYICCGDIVGYGPDPEGCLKRIIDLVGLSVVMGNHDAACCGLRDVIWFNEYAKEAIAWTRTKLAAVHLQYLRELPEKKVVRDITLVHGSPRNPISEYLLTEKMMRENIDSFDTRICLVGHSHVPMVFSSWRGKMELKPIPCDETLTLEKDTRYIINLGSVGQPRDGNPLACCALYDSDTGKLDYTRLQYDFKNTQRKIEDAGLPPYLAKRLEMGR